MIDPAKAAKAFAESIERVIFTFRSNVSKLVRTAAEDCRTVKRPAVNAAKAIVGLFRSAK